MKNMDSGKRNRHLIWIFSISVTVVASLITTVLLRKPVGPDEKYSAPVLVDDKAEPEPPVDTEESSRDPYIEADDLVDSAVRTPESVDPPQENKAEVERTGQDGPEPSSPGESPIDPDEMHEFITHFARSWSPPEREPGRESEIVAVIPDRRPEPAREPDRPQLPQVPEIVAVIPDQRSEPAREPDRPQLPQVPEIVAIIPDQRPEPVTILPEQEPDPASPPPPPPPVKPERPVASGQLVLESPWDGSYYTSLVEFRGTAVGFDSLIWRSDALDSGGTVPVAVDGTYSFSVSTNDYSNDVDVSVFGTDRAGGRQEISLVLVNDGVGPSIRLDSPVRGDYYRDEIIASGMVGAGPFEPEGIGEIKSLLWALGNDEPRPVIFDSGGHFSFRSRMGGRKGPVEIIFIAIDLNGNETRKTVSLQDGRLAPNLVISGLKDGDEYGAGIRLAGSVVDPYGGRGELGGIGSLQYKILAADADTRDGIVTGEITPDANGHFETSVMTGGLRGNQDITFIVTGKNGRQTVRTLRLRQGRSAIPDFSVDSADSSVLARWNPVPTATGYEVTVLGTGVSTVRYDTTGGPFLIRGLENGREYTFRVDALLKNGTVASHEVRSIPLADTTLKPSVTGEFRRIRISWKPVPGSESYTVLRSESPDGPFAVLERSVAGDEFLDTRATFGTRYWYSIAPSSYPELRSAPQDGVSLSSQGSNVEHVGSIDSLRPDSIFIEGDYAMIASREAGLVLVDITVPARPKTVGRSEMDQARDVAVEGSYAYVACGDSGLKVVNIDDPQRPVQVGSKLAGNAVALNVKGGFAYIADRDRGMRVLDVRDARDPVRIAATDNLEGHDLLLTGSTVYLAAGGNGVVIFDVSIPSQPRKIGRIPFAGAETIHLRDSILAVGGVDSGLGLYDVDQPDSPVYLSNLRGAPVTRLESSEDFLLVTSPVDLKLVDLRDPARPAIFRSYPVGASAALAVRGGQFVNCIRRRPEALSDLSHREFVCRRTSGYRGAEFRHLRDGESDSRGVAQRRCEHF